MCLSKRSTSNTSFVSLTPRYKFSHTSSELFIHDIENVGDNQSTVNAPHVHFAINVYGNSSRQGTDNFMSVFVC